METMRRLRRAKGITMKELGEKVGCAESTISQYENGKRAPDFETLLKISEELETSVDYLLTGRENGIKKKSPSLKSLVTSFLMRSLYASSRS